MSYNPFEHKPPSISLLLKQKPPLDIINVVVSSESENITSKLIEKQPLSLSIQTSISKPILNPTPISNPISNTKSISNPISNPISNTKSIPKSIPKSSPFSNIESEVETTIIPTSILYTQPIVDTDMSLDTAKVKADSSCWYSISSLCCVFLVLLILIIFGYYFYRWYYRTDIIEDKTIIEKETEIESEHII